MKNDDSLIYWDSCIFLSYINDEPKRVNIIEDVWRNILNDKKKVLTSTISIVEVAHGSEEKINWKLDPNMISVIDQIWSDPSINLVEFNESIAGIARDLIRNSLPKKRVLKSKDAIHLATAIWINKHFRSISEFFTYDDGLVKFGPEVGIKICHPYTLQPSLLNKLEDQSKKN